MPTINYIDLPDGTFEDFGRNMLKESDSFLIGMIDEGFFTDIEKDIRELCRKCVEHGIMLATERLQRQAGSD